MAPNLISFSPSSNTAARSANIVLTFDSPVQAGSGNILLRDTYGNVMLSEPIGGSPLITISGATVTINPPEDLAYFEWYSVILPAGIVTSLQGEAFAAETIKEFRTESSPVALDMTGSDATDVLHGSAFNDRLAGAGGNDFLSGFGGNDWLDGGDGDDQLTDTEGDNTLIGGAGNDAFSLVSSGTSRAEGGIGNDSFWAGGGNDTLDGGEGNDRFFISSNGTHAGKVIANGGAGDDFFRIERSQGQPVVEVTGGQGSDTYSLARGEGALVIRDFTVGPGGDVIDAESLMWSATPLSGNPFGRDGILRLVQEGADTLLQYDSDGAAGSARSFTTVARLSGVAASSLDDDNFVGSFRVDGNPAGELVEGTSGGDQLYGTNLDDTVRGFAGDDQLFGQLGDDQLDGGDGADQLYGGHGNDILLGGVGADTLDGAVGDDKLDGGDGNDRLVDKFGNDAMEGGAGDDYLESQGQGSSMLRGGEGHDYLVTRFGNDTLQGGNGHDTLEVNNLNYEQFPVLEQRHTAVLDGGEGNDTIWFNLWGGGAPMSVRATGGAGQDTFRVQSTAGKDNFIITDFKPGAGGDVLDLWFYIPKFGMTLSPFDPAANLLQLVQQGADTSLQYRGTEVVLLQGVQASSLVAENILGSIEPDGKTHPVNLTGTAGDDRLEGGYFADTLSGGAGADLLFGGAGNDVLQGGDGNDRLQGDLGANQLNGGAGLDYAVYDNLSRWNMGLVRGDGFWTINDYNITLPTAGSRYNDKLVDIERIQMTDKVWALDMDGTAGQVYRLYQAAFDRAPDAVGLGFWISVVDRGALNMSQVCDEFVKSGEFKSMYGTNPTNADIVTRFYTNILDREPDAGGFAHWIRVLDEKLVSVATVLSHFSESPENQDNLAKVIGFGFEYTPYTG